MIKLKKLFLWVGAGLVLLLAWWYFALPPFNKPASTTQTTQVSGTTIEIKNSAFSPNPIMVKAGEKVSVTNRDFTGHSVTADDGSFDSGVLGKDKSGSITAPTKPGTYKFHCSMHPTTMAGTLVVQ